MSDKTEPSTDLPAVIKSLRSYLLEKGHRFERGTHYKGKTSSSVALTALEYEGLGYSKYMQVGDPPVYVMLGRGHHEVHLFEPQDPKIREWLEDDKVALNDPEVRTYLLKSAGLSENELQTARKPQVFHITEVNNVYILTNEDA